MRYVLCDDHRLFLEPFAAALGRRGHHVVVVNRPGAVLRAVARHRAQMCVVDLKFPEGNGIEVLAEVRRGYPECRTVVLSGSTELRDAAAAASAGAAGFLRKDQPMDAIFAALDRIAAGGTVSPVPLHPRPAGNDQYRHVRQAVGLLTKRERQVLDSLVRAEDTMDIARSLGVAPSTARTHLQNVLVKLGAHSRLQAVALVIEAGVVDGLGELPPAG